MNMLAPFSMSHKRMIRKISASALLIAFLAVSVGCGPTSRSNIEEKRGGSSPNLNSGKPDEPKLSESDARVRLSGAAWLKDEEPRTLGEAQKRFHAAYQVKPDRRVLMAVAETHSFLTGAPAQEAELVAESGKWRIRYNGLDAGTVSEFADFGEGYKLLKNWARKVMGDKKIVPASKTLCAQMPVVHDVDPSKLMSALSSIDKQWTRDDMDWKSLSTGAQALTLLYAECLDVLQSADELAARALSRIAVAEELGGLNLSRSRCLLSDAMSYWSYSRQQASSLPVDDAVRRYLEGNEKALLASATESSAAPQDARFLYLRLLGLNRDLKSWQKLSMQWYSRETGMALPLLRTFSDVAREDALLPFAENLIVATNRSLLKFSDPDHPIPFEDFKWTYNMYAESREWMLKETMTDFESNLHRTKYDAVAPFLSQDIFESFYRANFNSAIALTSQCYMMMPSGSYNLSRFADSLKGAKDRRGAQLERWLKARVAAEEGKTTFADLEGTVADIASLGVNATMLLCGDMGAVRADNEPSVFLRFGKSVLGRLDSRPEIRVPLSQMAESTLLNLNLSYRLLQANQRNGMPRKVDTAVEQLLVARDLNALREILRGNKLRPRERLAVLRCLQNTASATQAQLESEYTQVAKMAPDDWWAVEPLYTSMLARKNFAQASYLVREWINSHKTFRFLDEVTARSALAQSLSLQGKHKEALDVLGKSQESEEFISLAMRAAVLEKLGRRGEAETWAHECLKRYPDNAKAIALMAGILWRDGKYAQAASLLSNAQSRISRTAWRFVVGKTFVEVFGGSPEKLELAAGVLKDAGLRSPDNLGQLAAAAYAADRPAEAFSILAQMECSAEQMPDLMVCAYRYLKRWKGEQAALAWLKKEMPKEFNTVTLAPYAFLSGQDELLFQFIDPQSVSDDVAILRCASISTTQQPNAQRRAALVKRFHGRSDFYALLADYLLDRPGGKKLFTTRLDNNQVCKAAFYVGWKTLSQPGNFFQDTDWYRLSLDTTAEDCAEYKWSWIWLSDIQLSLRRFSKLLNASAVDRLRVTEPKTGKWDDQRRFGLTDR